MTVARRDFLVGGACIAGLALAEYLRPRNFINLLGNRKIADILPSKFGAWTSDYDGDLVVPTTEGSLASRLYNDLVTRRYTNAETGEQVMLLAAYGGIQSDDLQLHRPETCYPAFGFDISNKRAVAVKATGFTVPAVFLTATAGGRVEDIVYWSRIGNFFPQSNSEQRSVKLKMAMQGDIGDGILIRASTIRQGDRPETAPLEDFLARMVSAIPPAQRDVLIGTDKSVAPGRYSQA